MTLSTVPRYDSSQIAKREDEAVVVGAGIAGLCAARILADYFTQVTVLERDSLPEEPTTRRGVPQAAHIHILYNTGADILDDLLPGYGEDLLSSGAVKNDRGSDWYVYTGGDFQADTSNRMPLYCASRPLFEYVLRRRVTDLGGVKLRTSHHLIEYRTTRNDTAICGVRVRNESGAEETLTADLVVDATGRTSRTPTWLENHGYPAPPTDEVVVDIGYSTGVINRPSDDRRAIRILPHESSREAAVTPIEGNRWQVGIVGRGDEHPPTTLEEFMNFTDSLAAPDVKHLLEDHEWTSTEIFPGRFPSSRRYRYEDLERFPDGLVVIGDAIVSYNPVYGQGMTVAILESLVLHHTIGDAGLDDLGRRYFQRVEEIVDVPWFKATAADSAFPETSGPIPAGAESYLEYMGQMNRAAHNDGEVSEASVRAIQLERPLSELLQPSIVRSVFGEPDQEAPVDQEAPDWVPSSLEEVGPLLEENLTNPEGVLEWPGVSPDSPLRTVMND